jgi:type IV pilus assembly protein PilA
MLFKVQRNKGFTLVELMIVVAIISILASVAVPFYQRYVAKSRITSLVLPAIHSMQNNISAYYAFRNQLPPINGDSELIAFTRDADTRFMDITWADWLSSSRLKVSVNTEATDPRFPSENRKPFNAIGSDNGRNVFYIVANESQSGDLRRLFWSYQGTLVAELGL